MTSDLTTQELTQSTGLFSGETTPSLETSRSAGPFSSETIRPQSELQSPGPFSGDSNKGDSTTSDNPLNMKDATVQEDIVKPCKAIEKADTLMNEPPLKHRTFRDVLLQGGRVVPCRMEED
jgi:hypothetical protein